MQCRVANMLNFHTSTVCSVDAVMPMVLVTGGELVQLPCYVMCCTRVRVPVGVDAIGGHIGILVVTVTSFIIRIIASAPPTVACRMTVYFTDLTRDILIGCGGALAAPITTPILATTILASSILLVPATVTAASSIIPPVTAVSIIAPVMTVSIVLAAAISILDWSR